MELIRNTGTPLLIIHLPIYGELKQGTEEYLLMSHERQALLDSLRRTSGRPVMGLLPYAPKPVPNLERLINSLEDDHPSAEGIKFYGDLLISALMEHRDLWLRKTAIPGESNASPR